MATPYEPPPDYPMVDERWRSKENSERVFDRFARIEDGLIDSRYFDRRLHRYPISQNPSSLMLKTRQFPEVAGIYGCEEQPALRRFTRYNQSIMDRDQPIMVVQAPPPPSTSFSKSSKKPSFFTGNWTLRYRKQCRPPLHGEVLTRCELNSRKKDYLKWKKISREERPMSMNLTDSRVGRSKSEASERQFSELRIPINHRRNANDGESGQTEISKKKTETYKTNITLDDVDVLRPKKIEPNIIDKNRYRYISSQIRKSCPDLESTCINLEDARVSKKRNKRAKEKAREARWRRKMVEEWELDDVLLWLQHCELDEVASLLIGYNLKGSDLLAWDHKCLTQLGLTNTSVRVKLLDELAAVRLRGPEDEGKDEKKGHKTLFDIVRQTSYDQVLAVETPLTTRDITVTHGHLGCLQITKVNGVNLPLRENDCLLEINERPGEQFKSALMLTKLISDSNGEAIRFVVLRRKGMDRQERCSNDASSSGVSSSPQSPIE
uniref:SAM domain-containing protein n=1 Tax=Heterorhabditis bacteriophora TaxID=37862 RepID=A0A1I7XJV4_HETBA